jgi:dTDP-4-amino-4,6-dideoxygalactose transaminase
LPHQLPSYSPLSARGLAAAAVRAATAPASAESELEGLLLDRCTGRSVALVGSGTQALQLALETASVVPGTLVALPAYSCYDLVSAAVGAGSRVGFYDVDPLTLGPDLSGIRRCIDSGARAVVVAYLCGFPIDWPAVRDVCAEAGSVLIEDAAQGVGASWGDVPAGGHGSMSVLSFGRGKGWTGGLGGALIVRDERLLERFDERMRALPAPHAAASFRAGVLATAQWALGRPGVYGLPARLPGLGIGETVFKDPAEPTRCPSFAAAAVLAHATAALRESDVRRERAAGWTRALKRLEPSWPGLEACRPHSSEDCGYLRFPLMVPDRGLADVLSRNLAALGIGRGYPQTLPSLPQAAEIVTGHRGPFGGAELLAQRLITLPTHSLIGPVDPQHTTRAMERVIDSSSRAAHG